MKGVVHGNFGSSSYIDRWGRPCGPLFGFGSRSRVSSLLVERKQELDPHSRATVIHCRALEIFQQWGVLDRFLATGQRAPHIRLELPDSKRTIAHLDFTELIDQTATAYALAIAQDRSERILLDVVNEAGLVDVQFGTEVLSFDEKEDSVHVNLRSAHGESSVSTPYLVGADGANSSVREQLGFKLEGKTYKGKALLADVQIDASRDLLGVWPTLLNHRGLIVGIRFGNRTWRIIDQSIDETLSDANTDDHITEIARELFGSGPVEIIWRSTYHKHERSVARFRSGRVMLAGDAAHLNSPAGGQGMNSGVQDAHNLAWKLAAAVLETDADVDGLLESYSQERHFQVAHMVQPLSDVAEHFQTAPPVIRETVTRLLDMLFGTDASTMTRRLSMLDVDYGASRLLDNHQKPIGSRVPDVLDTNGKRLYNQMPNGAILWAGAGDAAIRIANSLDLPAVNGETASLVKFFGMERFVALVRPDHIAGRVISPSDLLHREPEFRAALGRLQPPL